MNITINGDVNIFLNDTNKPDLTLDTNDAETLTSLIANIFGGACVNGTVSIGSTQVEKTPLKFNPNAEPFVPSSLKKCECECECDDSDEADDSDYDEDDEDDDSDYEDDSEYDDEDDRIELFRKICSTYGQKYSSKLFRDYDEWCESNGRCLNRYKKMTAFFDALAKKPVESVKMNDDHVLISGEINNLLKELYSLKTRQADNKKSPAFTAPVKMQEPAKQEPAKQEPAKQEPVKRKVDIKKLDLFQDICEKYNIDYTNRLFDEYETWCKNNGDGLNRYVKMSTFLDTKKKSNKN